MEPIAEFRPHPNFKSDLHAIAKKYDGDQESFHECKELIDSALNKIRLAPDREGKSCRFEPLSSLRYRRVRLFSMKNPPKGVRKDLRIVYRFNADENTVELLSIGFRQKMRPRPPEDPYSLAEARVDFE